MKYKILISFILCYNLAFLQVSDSTEFDYANERSFSLGWVSQNSVWSVEYGLNYYQLNELNNDNQPSMNSSFSDFLGCIGASYSGSVIANRKFTMDIHLDYAFYHSRPIVIELNDSSRHYLRGFHFGIDACKDLFPRKENVDLLLGLGFNTGRLLFGNWDLTLDDKTNRSNRYSNPFFAPKLSFEQRFFVFKDFSISIRAELQYDITSKAWKRKSNSLQPINEAEATGYCLRLTMGWRY